MSRYIYQLVPFALIFSEVLFRILNRKSNLNMKTYWNNRLYQIVSLVPFIAIGLYITNSSPLADELLMSKLFAILTLFAFLIVSMIQSSYKGHE